MLLTWWSAAALQANAAHACDKRDASGSSPPGAGRTRRIKNLQRPRTWLHDAGLKNMCAALRQPARGQPGSARRAVQTLGFPAHLTRRAAPAGRLSRGTLRHTGTGGRAARTQTQ